MTIDDGHGGKIEITIGLLLRVGLYVCVFSVLLFGRRLLPGVQWVKDYLVGPHVLAYGLVLAMLVWWIEQRLLRKKGKQNQEQSSRSSDRGR